MNKLKTIQYLLFALVLCFLGVFLIMPIFTVIEVGMDVNLLKEVFYNYAYRDGLLNSFAVAAVTSIMVFILALPAAIIYDRYEFFGKGLCSFAIMLPMILPPFVGALGFQQILGHYGVINSILTNMQLDRVDFLGGNAKFWSVCLIESLHLYPILYLNLVTALGNIDPAMEEAAKNLGGSKWFRFRKITLPLMRSGLFAGGSLVFIWSFTELGTPLMFGFNRITSVQIFNGITELETNAMPYSLVVVMLILSGIIYLLGKVFLGRNSVAMASRVNSNTRAKVLLSWRKYLPTLLFFGLTFISILPHIALVLSAFFLRWYGTVLPEEFTMIHFYHALSNKIVIPSISNSLSYSIIAMIVAIIIGIIISLSICRWNLKGAFIADFMVMISLAVPGIVVAFGYLGMTVKYQWMEKFFNPIDNPILLLATAYAVRRLPYVVRSLVAGLEQTSVELENAARNFGAGAIMLLRKITLPLIAANLIVGGIFAFSFSMLEVSDSLILAQKSEFYPITKAIFELSQILGTGPYIACAFGVWAMLFLASSIGAATWILGKKVGTAFKL